MQRTRRSDNADNGACAFRIFINYIVAGIETFKCQEVRAAYIRNNNKFFIINYLDNIPTHFGNLGN